MQLFLKIIKKASAIIYLFLLCFACNPKDYDNSILWTIKNNATGKTSYILGTIHKMDTTLIQFPDQELKDIARDCDIICTETLPAQVDKFYKENPYIFPLTQSQDLSNSLEDKYYNKLIQIVDSSRTELNNLMPYLDNIRLSRLAQFLKEDRQLMRTQLFRVHNYSPERDFIHFAQLNDLELMPLENLEDIKSYTRHSYGDNVSIKKSVTDLKQILDNYYNKDFIDIFKSYSEQNLNLIHPELSSDSIMVLRNKRIAMKIDSIITNPKKAFILVGASHLPFETGILNLLSKKGYSVKPFKIEINVKNKAL